MDLPGRVWILNEANLPEQFEVVKILLNAGVDGKAEPEAKTVLYQML